MVDAEFGIQVIVEAVVACPEHSFLMITGNISVMTGAPLYVFGSWERDSLPTQEMYIPLRPTASLA